MSEAGPDAELPSFWRLASRRKSVQRGIRVSAIVGSILILINQGEYILAAEWPPIWKILLTYIVPFSVSTYTGASMKLQELRDARSEVGIDAAP
ncbi:nitrate/nitrite transporter NrtS [Novosphingopyxis sp.]|uniref:nitrate/nitrite transporter NrtS n=1 Tax=Novosphingopyxis sp. TaxID=2709690 RepID=UPI003B5C7D25